MTNEQWLETLGTDRTIRSMIPMELQPGMPMPQMCEGHLLIYVPFYCMQPGQNCVMCSEKLWEVTFAAVTKQIVSAKDLRFTHGASSISMNKEPLPSNNRLAEQEYLLQDLLHQLDKIEATYRRTHSVPQEKLDDYRQQLFDCLLFKKQIAMYEDIEK